jgi:hypothetical protein
VRKTETVVTSPSSWYLLRVCTNFCPLPPPLLTAPHIMQAFYTPLPGSFTPGPEALAFARALEAGMPLPSRATSTATSGPQVGTKMHVESLPGGSTNCPSAGLQLLQYVHDFELERADSQLTGTRATKLRSGATHHGLRTCSH